MQISAEKTATLADDVAEKLWNLPNGITLARIALSPLLFALPLGIAASLIASWTLLRQQLLGLLRR